MTGETITTVEDLKALPSETILRGSAGQAYLILGGYIYGAGNARSMTYAEVRFGLPMTVLYRPDAEPEPRAAIAEEIAQAVEDLARPWAPMGRYAPVDETEHRAYVHAARIARERGGHS